LTIGTTTVNGTYINVGTLFVTGSGNVQSTFGIGGAANALSTFGVGGAANALSTLGIGGAANALSTLGIGGAANALSTLGVRGAATLANTLSVTGTATFSNTVNITGTTTINTDYVIEVTSNGNLGVTTGSPLLVYSFPKATYSSAKITAQVKNSSNTITQINEIVLAHDGTDSYITVYATVASPLGGNNGIYSVAINNANVELKFTQTSASSNAKIIAHLIK
jgi:hypothetical protein